MWQGVGSRAAAPPGNWVLIGLGSNLAHEGLAGPALLEQALVAIEARGFRLWACSSYWQSAAWPDASQPAFVNSCALVDAGQVPPRDVLAAMLAIEAHFGRIRGGERWAARSLDIDVLDYAGHIIEENGLTLPHPRMGERNFVLAPLAQLAPWWRHPVLGKSAADLLALAPPNALTQLRDCAAQASVSD